MANLILNRSSAPKLFSFSSPEVKSDVLPKCKKPTPIPYSLFPTPYSLLPTPYSLLPTP
ncbi:MULTISPECIES: hypothetical protein [Moorena]|uniref:hypothetical protein n=1 Tax=Moorena TaxID=1155738 RepID=UPI0002F84782|nr:MULTISPECIES: hypothetical protein [Moorena]NEP35123.1 hypothetical protein [Moorena sp. SIO3B2]NEP69678.1 hypothetical protein [Moorena sp. SIO3A5]NEQ08578.1 hypothetical protein [Moorena sp. SIO4E2]